MALALLKLLLQLQEFTFKDTAGKMRLDCFETHAPIWLSRGRLENISSLRESKVVLLYRSPSPALKGMPREQQANARIIFDLSALRLPRLV